MVIKEVICKYFEEYGFRQTRCEEIVKDMMIKYKEWSEILIKPQALNDSRLFTLERRIIEEEELRIKEFIIL